MSWFFHGHSVGDAVTYVGEHPGLLDSVSRSHGLHVSRGSNGLVAARTDYLFRPPTYDVVFDGNRVNAVPVGELHT
ncbi:MAG: hypothetical protein ACRDTC_21710, partial [Pseudonocardiaceae bacterium]